MDLKKISQLVEIGQLAIELHKAEQAVSNARDEYHLAWNRYETDDEDYGKEYPYPIHPELRVGKGHADFDNACLATNSEHEAYRAKKRIAYNIKRRLQTACRNF